MPWLPIANVLEVLERAEDGATIQDLERELDVPRERIEKAVETLDHSGTIYPQGHDDDGATLWAKTPARVRAA